MLVHHLWGHQCQGRRAGRQCALRSKRSVKIPSSPGSDFTALLERDCLCLTLHAQLDSFLGSGPYIIFHLQWKSGFRLQTDIDVIFFQGRTAEMSCSRTIIFMLKNRLSETLVSHKSGRGVTMCHELKTTPAVLVKSRLPVQSGPIPVPFSLPQPSGKVPRGCLGPHLPNTSGIAMVPTAQSIRSTGKALPARNPCPADASLWPVSTKGPTPPTPAPFLQHCIVHCGVLQETLCSPKKDGEHIVKEDDTGLFNFVLLGPLNSAIPSARYPQLCSYLLEMLCKGTRTGNTFHFLGKGN